jgi:hypothetical protein
VNVLRIALLLFCLLPGATPAADVCFCLVDGDDNFRHSCTTQQQGYRQVVQCLDDAGEPYRVDDLSGWTRLAAGEGRCSPCRPLQPRTEGPIRRGDEDDARTPDTAHDRTE